MSDDKSFGASLWRRHTTTALSAQAREGARTSFGEAVHLRRLQFSQRLMRRVGGREQGDGGQRTFVTARRVVWASSGGGSDDASGPRVADEAGEFDGRGASNVAVPVMQGGPNVARQHAQAATGGLAVSTSSADAGAVMPGRVGELRGDAVHDSSLPGSRDAVARGVESSHPRVSGNADHLNDPGRSGAPATSLGLSSSGSMPPVGMTLRSAIEVPAIRQKSLTPLAVALAPIVNIGVPMVTYAADVLARRPGVSEYARVETSPGNPVYHDAVSGATNGVVARKSQHGSMDRLPLAQQASRASHGPAKAWLTPHAGNDAAFPESGGTLAGASADAAPVDSAARPAQPSSGAIDRFALPFAARPLARALMSASGIADPVAPRSLSPIPPVSMQPPASPSAPPGSVARVVQANATRPAANLAASERLMTGASARSHQGQNTALRPAPSSALEQMLKSTSLVLRRAGLVTMRASDVSSASSVGNTDGAPQSARLKSANDALQMVAASNLQHISKKSDATSGSPAQSAASDTFLPRVSTTSAAQTAITLMPLARESESAIQPVTEPTTGPAGRIEARHAKAIVRAEPDALAMRDAVVLHRSQSIDATAAASIIVKEKPLSSAIRRATGASRDPHPTLPALDTPRPPGAIVRFVDIERAAHPLLARKATRQDRVSAIDGETQPSLTHFTAAAGNAAGPDTRARATPATVIDREQQLPGHVASLPGVAAPATWARTTDGATSRPPAMKIAQRTPATSLIVRPQASASQTVELPLRLARASRELRGSNSERVATAAWTSRPLAPAGSGSEPTFVDSAAEQYGVMSPVSHIMRDAGAPAAAGTPPPTAHANPPPAGLTANASPETSELVEQAWQLILDKLAIEQERRGYTSWA